MTDKNDKIIINSIINENTDLLCLSNQNKSKKIVQFSSQETREELYIIKKKNELEFQNGKVSSMLLKCKHFGKTNKIIYDKPFTLEDKQSRNSSTYNNKKKKHLSVDNLISLEARIKAKKNPLVSRLNLNKLSKGYINSPRNSRLDCQTKKNSSFLSGRKIKYTVNNNNNINNPKNNRRNSATYDMILNFGMKKKSSSKQFFDLKLANINNICQNKKKVIRSNSMKPSYITGKVIKRILLSNKTKQIINHIQLGDKKKSYILFLSNFSSNKVIYRNSSTDCLNTNDLQKLNDKKNEIEVEHEFNDYGSDYDSEVEDISYIKKTVTKNEYKNKSQTSIKKVDYNGDFRLTNIDNINNTDNLQIISHEEYIHELLLKYYHIYLEDFRKAFKEHYVDYYFAKNFIKKDKKENNDDKDSLDFDEKENEEEEEEEEKEDSDADADDAYENYVINNLKVIKKLSNLFTNDIYLKNLDKIKDKIQLKLDKINSNLSKNSKNSENYNKYDIYQTFNENKDIIVFDLDETLIHSRIMKLNYTNKDIKYDFLIEEFDLEIFVRPGIYELLQYASENFNCVLMTAGEEDYCNELVDRLKIQKYFSLIVSREYCMKVDQLYIKDIDIFKNLYKSFKKHNTNKWAYEDAEALRECIIIDNNIYSFAMNLSQGVLVSSFFEDKKDTDLYDLIDYLKELKEVKINEGIMMLHKNESHFYFETIMLNLDE